MATTESEAVIASACLTVDEAREWASKQGRRVPGPRVTILRRSSDYRWSAWVIYANGITKPEAALTTGNIIRAPTPDEFLALVPREPCAEGPDGVSRRTCLFTDWPDYETEPSDYLEDDGYIETGILQTKSEPSPLPGWALVRSHLPLEERAALNAGEWCEVATLADYIGPSALISDTRDWAGRQGGVARSLPAYVLATVWLAASSFRQTFRRGDAAYAQRHPASVAGTC